MIKIWLTYRWSPWFWLRPETDQKFRKVLHARAARTRSAEVGIERGNDGAPLLVIPPKFGIYSGYGI